MKKDVFTGLFIIAACWLYSCQEPEQEQHAGEDHSLHQDDTLRVESVSEKHFHQAEKYLTNKQYKAAADQLQEGIVRYRSEMGRVRGDEAAKINKAIWTLTRLRTRLKRGDSVKEDELRTAIGIAVALHHANRVQRIPVKKETVGNPVAVPVIQK